MTAWLVDQRRVAPLVDDQCVANADQVGVFRARFGAAAQDRLDPGHQLRRGKRLDHVIVGAEFQPKDDVRFFSFGGQDQDGQGAGARFLFQGFADLQAVAVGEHQVKDQQVRAVAFPGTAAAAWRRRRI